ncbi:MAG: putative aminohydrolase SsnA [Clostridium sp.]|nr:putative aminohydrolase SsnA [Clostridium sp.]MBO6150183.1 putative aminohydrolase SsnA [Clostridium sp.]
MLLIGNGKVVTGNQEQPFLENGSVVLNENTVLDVGDYDNLKKIYADAEFIDAHGGIIMPAFINTHEHIYSAMARGLSINGYNPKGFLEILDGQWWTIDRNLDNELTKLSALATYIECIRNGVTTIFDHHASFGEIPGSLFAIEEAARETGVRSCLCYEISDRDGEEKMRQAVKENVDFAKHALADDSDMIAGMMGMHASFTISDKTMELCRQEKPEEIGYHIHVAEGILDLELCLKEHAKRIVDRLYDWDVLGRKTLLAHCIYINPHEMDLIKDTDTMVVHNPESNMGNACGCPPTMEIVHRGIVTGLGTDGYTHDMLESWKVANILHKHHLCDPNAAWAEVPQMLFSGNREIAGRYFKKELGVLKKGAAADVIIMDYIPPTPMHAGNLNGHMLFGMSGRMVRTTIGSGKVLMKDRELVNVDEAAILAKVREGAARLAKKINGK